MIRWEVEDGQDEEPVALFAWPLGVKTRIGRITRTDNGTYEWCATLGDGDDSVLRCDTTETLNQARTNLIAAVMSIGAELQTAAASAEEAGAESALRRLVSQRTRKAKSNE